MVAISTLARYYQSGYVISAVLALVAVATVAFSSNEQAAADRDWSKCVSVEKPNCSEQQARAFNKCIERASEDGELTDDEYFTCAYSIYA
jgi:hypothetical protein